MSTQSIPRRIKPQHVELHKDLRAPPQVKSAPCALDDFLSRPESCRRYRISLRTAEMMAHKGKGPKVTHLGKRAFYHVDDIAAWCEAQRAKSVSRFAKQEEAQ